MPGRSPQEIKDRSQQPPKQSRKIGDDPLIATPSANEPVKTGAQEPEPYVEPEERISLPKEREEAPEWPPEELAGKGEERADEKPKGLQAYTPSALLVPGQWEVKLFNNLYTQIAGFNGDANRQFFNNRANYFTTSFALLTGLSPRVNVGLEGFFKSVYVQPRFNFSPTGTDTLKVNALETLAFAGDITEQRTGLASIGPRIKWQPFINRGNLTLQSTLHIPLLDSMQGRAQDGGLFLAWDRYSWFNQIFFDKKLGAQWSSFFELDLNFDIDRYGKGNNAFSTPIKGFVSYFPTNKITLYAMSEFAPTWAGEEVFSSWYRQEGLGFKYQLFPALEAELLVTNFMAGKNAGAGATYNLGFRFLR